MSSHETSIPLDRPAWNLDWLTPMRCRLILVLVLVVGIAGHVIYLHSTSIDLAGDEAQYWDWSRNLDLSYYSKGPLVAYIIRASCAIFGDTMPAVRYPAILLNAGTLVVLYLLTRKLFGSERLALGTTLLFEMMPAFIAGRVLMTIDPPMFFCWALATYFAAVAIFDGRKWMWMAVGIVVGLGFLAKYVEFVWFIGLFGCLAFRSRERKFAGAFLAFLIASLFTIPVLLWNHQHDWVSFRHVAHQTGATGGGFLLEGVPVYFLGQIGVVGPTMAYLMVVAIVIALKSRSEDPHRDKLIFLLWIGLPLFFLTAMVSIRTKVQLNWPVPAYFTLHIVTAYFLSQRLQSIQSWKPWRGWFWATIVIGIVLIPIARESAIIFPILKPIAHVTKKPGDDLDPLARLRGWRDLGMYISHQLPDMGPDAFILCDDYQQTAETAFYVEGNPRTYCAGSYFGKRMSQYDMWPDRRLDETSPLIGKNAIYVGKGGSIPGAVEAAFERVERLPFLDIEMGGLKIKRFTTWRCYGFKGMRRSSGQTDY